MDPPADALSGTSAGGGSFGTPDLGDFMEQLNLDDEEFDDLVIDEADPEINESVRWLALARVHTDKTFSQTAFYKDMRAAWNPAQPVRFRPVGPKLFVVQASCLGDWERMMYQGPWIFRNLLVLMVPYDGFTKAEEVPMVFMPIWLQIHKIPEGFCRKNIVENLLKNSGEILEMRLNGNTRGDYIRVRVRHDVRRPLTKYVGIVRGKERQVYLVRYEKLARFCSVCGIIGHDCKECGSGVHEEKDKKYGPWLYADGLNKPPPNDSYGRGRTQKQHTPQSQQQKSPGKTVVDPDILDTATSPAKEGQISKQGDPTVRKRLSMDNVAPEATALLGPGGLLALTQGHGEDGAHASPTSSASSKRARVDSSGVSGDRSAASLEEDRRMQ
ncbi:hypothetical protein ZWY2020_043869 [Hordeum vulgare]|nr:hypothetical protein ZWY2020_043869 [Hordeum vulgare]